MNDRDRKLKARYIIMIAVILLVFAYLVSGLVRLQLDDTETYVEQAEDQKTLTIKLRGKRGNIIDADSVILAEDEWIYNVTFYKDTTQSGTAAYERYTRSIIDTIGIVEENGGSMAIAGNLRRNEETGEWEFAFGSGVSDAVLATRERQWRSNN